MYHIWMKNYPQADIDFSVEEDFPIFESLEKAIKYAKKMD